jgi:hypothetical protein
MAAPGEGRVEPLRRIDRADGLGLYAAKRGVTRSNALTAFTK